MVAWLGSAYEQLDDQQADRLEEQLFRPVQRAYGRAKRTHAQFGDPDLRAGLTEVRQLIGASHSVPAGSCARWVGRRPAGSARGRGIQRASTTHVAAGSL